MFDFAIEGDHDYQRRIDVSVAAEDVAAVRRKEAAKIRKTVRIKGFRKGKVPVRMVEERYGPAIDERMIKALVNQAFRAAVRQHDLSTIGEPVVSNLHYRPGEPLAFRIDVEVIPKIKIERTGGFHVSRPKIEVSEADTDKMIEGIREERAVLEPVERAPQSGDVVSVVIRQTGGDGAAAEGKPYRFEVGAGHAIPAVEEAILSLAPEEEGAFDIAYPDDFGSNELAGTTRSLNIRLESVHAKLLPEANDEFAKQVGDYATLAELRAVVKEGLQARAKQETDRKVGEQLVDAVIEANAFEVPPSLVSHYLDRVIDTPDGGDPAQVEEARKSAEPAITRQVKRDLVLESIIDEQKLKLSDQEFDARLSELGKNRGKSLVEVRRALVKDKRLDSLRHSFAVDRALQFLRDNSKTA